MSKVFLDHYNYFFLTVGQNNFGNKIPFIFFRKVYQGSVDDHGKNEDQDQKYHQNNDCSTSGYSLVPEKEIK